MQLINEAMNWNLTCTKKNGKANYETSAGGDCKLKLRTFFWGQGKHEVVNDP